MNRVRNYCAIRFTSSQHPFPEGFDAPARQRYTQGPWRSLAAGRGSAEAVTIRPGRARRSKSPIGGA